MRGQGGHKDEQSYQTRFFMCLVAVLLFAYLLIQLWPLPDSDPEPIVYENGEDFVEIEEIQPTQQRSEPPPPPRPLPPVAVQDEVELDEMDVDYDADLDYEMLAEDPGPPAMGDDSPASASPDRQARQLRLVEPDYSSEARSDNVRAQVVVEVLVNEDGEVEEATIIERALLNDDNEPIEQVEELGYGLEDSALRAARRTTFIPAQSDGESVSSRTTITIRFGV